MRREAAREEAVACVPLAENAPRAVPTWLARAGLVAIVVAYFALLGAHSLTEPDEARYAEIPREMLVGGDWVTPHLNYVKYFEKPPLFYWLVGAGFVLFGISDFVARLWLAVFTLGSIAVAYALARSIYGRWAACAAAALLATMPLFFGVGQVLTLDTPLSGWLALGLGSFWFAYQGRQPRWAYVLALYAATALGVLTKGPVAAVLTAGVIVVFLVLRRDLPALRWTASPAGMAVFLLIALPWFVLITQRNPEFLHYFIVDQHFDRYVRPDEHQEAFWFYVPIVFGGALPWSAFAVLAPAQVAPLLRRLLRLRVSAGTLFLATWCAVIFLFFSASGSKIGTYVLPMFCPLAVLAARFFEEVLSSGSAAVLRRGYVFIAAVGLIAVIGSALVPLVVDEWRPLVVASHVLASGAVLAVAAVAGLWLTHRGARFGGLAVLWAGVLVLQLIAMSARTVAGTYPRLGAIVRTHAQPQDLVVGYKHYVQGVTYYGRRRVVQVKGHGELEFGRQHGAHRAFFWESEAELLDAWASGRRMFLIINRSQLEPLRAHLQPPPRELAGEGRKVIVVNFPVVSQ